MLSRRAFFGKVAVGAAVATAASAITAGSVAALSTGDAPAPATDATSTPSTAGTLAGAPSAAPAAPPWELLQPLAPGAALGAGWTLAGLSPVNDGSCIVTLQSARGRSHRVHVCRNDGRPQGIVYTDRFDLVVMNGGQGDLPTDERLAQAVGALAHVLAANERAAGTDVLASLLPHAERLDRFAAAGSLR